MRLLAPDPAARLGSSAGGAQDVKDHPFFQGLDWDALLRRAPLQPLHSLFPHFLVPNILIAGSAPNWRENFVSTERHAQNRLDLAWIWQGQQGAEQGQHSHAACLQTQLATLAKRKRVISFISSSVRGNTSQAAV